MVKKQLYTTLIRTKKFEYIHLDENMLLKFYYNRKLPVLKLVNAKHNSVFKNGKIYEISFGNETIYVGSRYETLKTRLSWHKTNKKSQVFNNKDHKPDIRLIVNAPCNDRKELEKIENECIILYSEKYGEKLLNKRCNPLGKKQKMIVRNVEMEDEEKLGLRIGLKKKIKIKEYKDM